MAKRTTLALLVFFCIAAQQCPAATGSEQAAASDAFAYRERVQQALNECAAQFQGKGGEYFQFLWHLWSKRNEALFVAAEKSPSARDAAAAKAEKVRLETLPLPLRPATSPARQYERCDSLARQTQSGALDFSVAYPDEAGTLQRLVSSKPEFRHEKRNVDFTIGCMKKEWNTGNHDAKAVRNMCECQTGVIVNSASDEEIAVWLRDMSAANGKQQEVVERTQWLQKALPAIAACKTAPGTAK